MIRFEIKSHVFEESKDFTNVPTGVVPLKFVGYEFKKAVQVPQSFDTIFAPSPKKYRFTPEEIKRMKGNPSKTLSDQKKAERIASELFSDLKPTPSELKELGEKCVEKFISLTKRNNHFWNSEEDKKLLSYIKEHGTTHWVRVAKIIFGEDLSQDQLKKTVISCQNRFQYLMRTK